MLGHLERMAAAGIGVYVGGGGSGEGYTLSTAERFEVMRIAASSLTGRVPVRAMGVEPRSATEMVEFLYAAAEAGVEAAQVYSLDPGHGHRPTPAEVEAYFSTVVEHAPLPIVLSTHQSVGYRVRPPLLASLATDDRVVGVNCTHPDLGYLAAVIDAVRVPVWVGGPGQALAAAALGAAGFLSSEANLAPEVVMAEDFDRILRLSDLLYGAGGIRAIKAVLAHRGLPGGSVRPPLLPIDAATLDRVLAGLDALGIR